MVLVGGCFWSRWPLLAIGRVGLGECSCDMPHAQLRHAGIFWLSSRANVSLVTAQTFDLILNLCVILRTAMIQQLEAHKIAEFGWRGFDDRGSVSANQLGGKARCLSQPARDRPIGSGTSRSYARQTGAREEGRVTVAWRILRADAGRATNGAGTPTNYQALSKDGHKHQQETFDVVRRWPRAYRRQARRAVLLLSSSINKLRVCRVGAVYGNGHIAATVTVRRRRPLARGVSCCRPIASDAVAATARRGPGSRCSAAIGLCPIDFQRPKGGGGRIRQRRGEQAMLHAHHVTMTTRPHGRRRHTQAGVPARWVWPRKDRQGSGVFYFRQRLLWGDQASQGQQRARLCDRHLQRPPGGDYAHANRGPLAPMKPPAPSAWTTRAPCNRA